MGIQGLTKLLNDECPNCIKEYDLNSLTGRKIAIDASMAMYQFLIAVRSGSEGVAATMLTNEAGEVTSHIQGMFNRTIKLLTSGLKPVYVFDGKPPTLKGGELAKRAAKRVKAETDWQDARENGTTEDVDKFSKRLVRVTTQHNEDCKTLLRLMGVPVVDASCEAEAQCAALARDGVVFGTGTEDMDALTFRTPKLIRRLTTNKNQPIMEVDYAGVLEGLGLTHEEFVDMCILCGCDYTDSIRGIGPKKALMLIKKHHSIEEILKHLDRSKHGIPADWIPGETPTPLAKPAAKKKKLVKKKAPEKEGEEEEGEGEGDSEGEKEAEGDKGEGAGEAKGDAGEEEAKEEPPAAPVVQEAVPADKIPMYKEARRLFLEPDVFPANTYDLKWTDPNVEELTTFLVEKMQFNAERVAAGIKKLKEARKKGGQTRMDTFFKSTAPPPGTKVGVKRPAEVKKGGKGGSAKKPRGGGAGKGKK
ncbi:PIN domain-like protein [Tribonema minus]|uniref:Flap endonuclease 1 n=1 Tax=Tribonema minus TaxID=303371 RepID=A0A835Z748_9STRA|nr:PIN domain-like protein [Tribonema minus]